MKNQMTDAIETLDTPAAPQSSVSQDMEPRMPLTDETRVQAMEAILFASGHPVPFAKLSEVLECSIEWIQQAIQILAGRYDDHGIQLILVDDACQLVTREEYMPYIRAALGIRRGGNLSRASLETLAIVAYNQPVTRAYIDEVRGVDTGYVVTSLLEKGLLTSKGRLDAPGRPTLYGTTDMFLRVFGLERLADLPPAAVFLQKNEDGENPDAAAVLLNEE